MDGYRFQTVVQTLQSTWLYLWCYQLIHGSLPRGTPMTDGGGKKRLNLNDAVVSPFFVLAAAIDADIVDMEIFSVDFADPLVSSGHAELSLAAIIGATCIIIAIITNRPSLSYMGVVETWVAVVTIGLTVLPPFVPMLQWLLGHTIAALIAVVIQAAGFYVLAYIGGND